MEKGRTIFIWDIHWCYKEFKLLLKKINLTENDKIYLTWDVINRWPKSYKTLKYIFKNKEQFKLILWNQEVNFLNWIEKWKYIYDKTKFIKLEKKLENEPEILEYLKNLPAYIETPNFLLLHGWLIPWKKLSEHSIKEITSTREYNNKPWYYYYKWIKKVIYWHWWLDWLRIRKNTIWLDTWCVYGNRLTAYILETWEVIQQTALDIYINVYKNKNRNIKEI